MRPASDIWGLLSRLLPLSEVGREDALRGPSIVRAEKAGVLKSGEVTPALI